VAGEPWVLGGGPCEVDPSGRDGVPRLQAEVARLEAKLAEKELKSV